MRAGREGIVGSVRGRIGRLSDYKGYGMEPGEVYSLQVRRGKGEAQDVSSENAYQLLERKGTPIDHTDQIEGCDHLIVVDLVSRGIQRMAQFAATRWEFTETRFEE